MNERDDRRSSRRWRTLLKAAIMSDRRSSPIECIVRDLSDTGARIYFANAAELPFEFELEVPNKGLRVEARVIWSRGANHGVKFKQRVRAWTDPLRAAAA